MEILFANGISKRSTQRIQEYISRRFEARTLAIGEAIKLGAAIDYLSRIGMQMIHDYEALMHLFLYLVLVQDSELFYECVRALKAFASFHYKETIARKVGLGSHAPSGVKAYPSRAVASTLPFFRHSS
ncbi:uncharacterized protein LOC110699571 isoform X2 [Chenopodium quinoa]|uniref:uncharacterized protein LOC110699571 isoform X2 n=1 Tax=Chenopodium quinoa TaxID=63459 RepID=UPI000B78E39B|nr:uncharacterized protein LOC110699571 isoform X2 [Chenopodium quinoa]